MSKVEFVNDYHEVDEALGEKFMGLLIDGEPLPVTYQSPDIDFEDADTPSLIFYRTEPFYDASREMTERVIRDNPKYDSNGNLITIDMREAPEPWSLTYVVRYKYGFHSDGVKINSFIRKRFPRRNSFITINGRDYDVTFISQSLPMSNYKDFGKTDDGEPFEFQEQMVFRVDIMLDIHDRWTTKSVREIITDTHIK